LTASIDEPAEVAHYRARLQRAEEHYRDFGRTWSAYLESRPHRLIIDTEGDRATVRVVRTEPIPPDLALSLGEFLYQLRAALDNCLYAVAMIDSGLDTPPNATALEWPICVDATAWAKSTWRRDGLSAPIRAALEAIQPYQAERPDLNCLRILNDLARIDRHRALHLVAMYGSWANVFLPTNQIADFEPRSGSVIDADGVVATFRWLSDDRELTRETFDFNVELEVELADVGELPGLTSEQNQRPWGSLDKRMHALRLAVAEYTFGLEAIARDERAKRCGK
jgi:hypothetical protein